MDTRKIVAELEAERKKIDRAIAALTIMDGSARSTTTTRDKDTQGGGTRGGRRQLSPAARKRLSRLLKARWASGKMGKRRAKAA